MTGMTLQEAIAEVRRNLPSGEIDADALSVFMKSVASGDLIPVSDARRAVALAYQKAADMAAGFGWTLKMFDDAKINAATDDAACEVQRQIAVAILALADQDALADVRTIRHELDAQAVYIRILEKQLAEAIATPDKEAD